jgi:Protein of unknown function (DUF3892)
MNHDRRLLAVGGVNPDGAHWRISEAEAIEAIETGRWSFSVPAEGRDMDVVVALSKYGNKYLKGAADQLQPVSLLALSECG